MNHVKEKSIKEMVAPMINNPEIPCQYFELGSLLVNVFKSSDGLMEYSIFKKCGAYQMYSRVELLTVGLMSKEKLTKFLLTYHYSKMEEMD
ncbi:hypothetical protein [Calidifontibacillus erzurumensis]|uniref:Uncharacterized protein n=1 Tax=Calidifontibacillus erzurumensis TaxID=2741433 RepID=A0A8J8KBK9_9BACI|nr:hypothetical protein [Calidifontibacillus erzurumensis]NSL51727.1 hypothetical protein [Calidifontibacillus erzurumensis]